jgi:hypothetical protein
MTLASGFITKPGTRRQDGDRRVLREVTLEQTHRNGDDCADRDDGN